MTEIGKEVLHDLKNIEKNLSESNCYENFDFIPYYFRDFIYDFITILKHHLRKNLLSVILFGSVARGKWTSESDIDLFLIISNNVKNKTILHQELTSLILDFYESYASRNIIGKKQFHSIQLIPAFLDDLNTFRTLFYDIAMDGIIILDNENIGKEFMEKIKLKMRMKGLKRIYISDEDFYWKRDRIEFGELIEL
ncbi:MAG: nucleotidyltransferase domain-containing protein [Candidatus Helarchaeota archaeon]